jgi:hypothetical protein
MRENPAGITMMAVGDGDKWDFIFSIGMPYQYDQPEMIVVNSSQTLSAKNVMEVLNSIVERVQETNIPVCLYPTKHTNVPNAAHDICISFQYANEEEKKRYPPNLSRNIHFALMDTWDVPSVIAYV